MRQFIGMIADRVKHLAPDAAMDSWELLFKPENAKKLADCGIVGGALVVWFITLLFRRVRRAAR